MKMKLKILSYHLNYKAAKQVRLQSNQQIENLQNNFHLMKWMMEIIYEKVNYWVV